MVAASGFTNEELNRRQEGVFSWLALCTDVSLAQVADLYVEGLSAEQEAFSRLLTQDALFNLASSGVLKPPTVNPSDGRLTYAIPSDWLATYKPTTPLEYTPREQAFLDTLEDGVVRTADELTALLSFIEDSPGAQEPWRTPACLGHLVVLEAIVQMDDRYQILAQSLPIQE